MLEGTSRRPYGCKRLVRAQIRVEIRRTIKKIWNVSTAKERVKRSITGEITHRRDEIVLYRTQAEVRPETKDTGVGQC